MGGGVPPGRPRINTGQSGESGDGSPPVESRGKAPIGGLGTKSPEAEAFCTFAHNILKNGHRKCVFGYIDSVRNKMKDANTARWL